MFILDNLILSYLKSLATNGYIQFATLVGLWVVAEVVLPGKKVKK